MDDTRLFPRLRRGPRLWAIVFGIATAVGLFFTLFNYAATSLVGEASAFVRHLGPLADWWLWALLIPLIVWLARRFPIELARPLPGIALHTGLGLAVAAFELGAYGLFSQFYYGTILGSAEVLPLDTRYTLLLGNWLPTAFMMYWIIAIAVHAVDYARRSRKRELELSRLQAQLARARLRALEMQLHPHFLFNTLNTIASLMRDGRGSDAVEMVAGLGDLLRRALIHTGEQEIPLKEELEFIEQYLELEKARFSDRLTVELSVPSETLDALVPNMILQPLVENAMRHGIAPLRRRGTISIQANRSDGDLRLEVRDNGRGPGGITRRPHRGRGVGLRNTADRLRHLYGGEHVFEVAEANGGGTRVHIAIPWHTERRPLNAAAS